MACDDISAARFILICHSKSPIFQLDKRDIVSIMIIEHILLAVLSLWALLWVSFTRDGEGGESKKRTAAIGLFWIYCAITIAVVALGLLLWSEFFGCACPNSHARRIAEGLLVASFAMGITNVFQSAISIGIKIWRGKTAFDAMVEFPAGLYMWSPVFISVLGIALSIFSVLAVYYDRLFLIGGAVLICSVFTYFIYQVYAGGSQSES